MGDEKHVIRLAAVQAASVFLDREATVEKACRLIREAGQQGADVVAFPEGFIPGHPNWFHYYPVSDGRCLEWNERLFRNALEVPSAAFARLSQAAREAGTHVVIGVCEKVPGSGGSMYNSMLFIDRSGDLIGHHRKWLPTAGERLVHMPGREDTLHAWPADFGRLSGLICGENYHPLAIYTLIARGTQVHVASWPPHFAPGQDMYERIMIATRAIAFQAKVFVINAVGLLDEHAREEMGIGVQDRMVWPGQRGSTIVGPAGQILAGPLPYEEGILYADVDLHDLFRPRIFQDLAGHYARHDLFELRIKGVPVRPDGKSDEGGVPDR